MGMVLFFSCWESRILPGGDGAVCCEPSVHGVSQAGLEAALFAGCKRGYSLPFFPAVFPCSNPICGASPGPACSCSQLAIPETEQGET